MLNYIGTKIIKAEFMSEKTFRIDIKKEIWPENKSDSDGYMVVYPDGYESWSPVSAFESAYRQIQQSEINLINKRKLN